MQKVQERFESHVLNVNAVLSHYNQKAENIIQNQIKQFCRLKSVVRKLSKKADITVYILQITSRSGSIYLKLLFELVTWRKTWTYPWIVVNFHGKDTILFASDINVLLTLPRHLYAILLNWRILCTSTEDRNDQRETEWLWRGVAPGWTSWPIHHRPLTTQAGEQSPRVSNLIIFVIFGRLKVYIYCEFIWHNKLYL